MLRKFLAFIAFLFFILVMFLQFIFPTLMENTVRTRLSDKLATHDVVVQLSSTPNIAMALGKVDSFSALSHGAKIGNVYFEEISAAGENLEIDMLSLLAHNELVFNQAKQVEFKGVITELNLKELIKRDDKFQNVEVKITPEEILATSSFKVFGQEAQAELSGNVIVENGALVFKMQRLSVTNSMLGTLKLNSLFSDITLVNRGRLPFNAEFTDTRLAEGKVFIEAGRE